MQRLNSPTPKDNRITFGCINVPAKFYAKVIRPLFGKTTGVVYILPETKPLSDVFWRFETDDFRRRAGSETRWQRINREPIEFFFNGTSRRVTSCAATALNTTVAG